MEVHIFFFAIQNLKNKKIQTKRVKRVRKQKKKYASEKTIYEINLNETPYKTKELTAFDDSPISLLELTN